jgi:hypothetical protein
MRALSAQLSGWLLGPRSTFRNGGRNWLYTGYLVAVVALLAAVAARR